MSNLRLAANLILLAAIILLPYWVYLPLGLALVIIFPLYWEGMLFAYLIDCLYGRGIESLFSLFSPLAFTVLILLVLLLPVREHIRVNV